MLLIFFFSLKVRAAMWFTAETSEVLEMKNFTSALRYSSPSRKNILPRVFSVALCNNCRTLCTCRTLQYLSHYVITLVALCWLEMDARRTSKPNKWIIIIDKNDNNNNNNNNNNNAPVNCFLTPFSQVGAEETVHINCGLPASRSLKGSIPVTLSLRTTLRPWDSVTVHNSKSP